MGVIDLRISAPTPPANDDLAAARLAALGRGVERSCWRPDFARTAVHLR